MGTRSLTVFVESFEDEKTKKRVEKEFGVLYRQMDGYPTGHGRDLKEFLSGFVLRNGIPVGKELPEKFANGMTCLACQVIGYLKDGKPGNFYLYPAKTRNCWEDYIYTLTEREGKVWFKVQRVGLKNRKKTLFEGFVEDFDPEKAENS